MLLIWRRSAAAATAAAAAMAATAQLSTRLWLWWRQHGRHCCGCFKFMFIFFCNFFSSLWFLRRLSKIGFIFLFWFFNFMWACVCVYVSVWIYCYFSHLFSFILFFALQMYVNLIWFFYSFSHLMCFCLFVCCGVCVWYLNLSKLIIIVWLLLLVIAALLRLIAISLCVWCP